MEIPPPTSPKIEPQDSPSQKGRGWRIASIVVALHVALLGSVAVLIQACSKSPSTTSTAEAPHNPSTLAEENASAKEDGSLQAKQNITLPNSDVLTPEEHLPTTDLAKNFANTPAPASSPAETVKAPVEVAKVPELAKEESVPAPAVPSPSASVSSKYVVKKGDTLFKIAKKNSISLNELLAANKLSAKASLKVGQSLVIPGKSKTEIAKVEKPSGNKVLAKESSRKTHSVKSGESLVSIAKHYGVTVQSLLQVNQINNPKKIRVNQKLLIPVSKVAQENSTPQKNQGEENLRPAASVEPLDKGEVVKGI